MIEVLKELDVQALIWVNHTFKSTWMDQIMIFCSGKFTWLPLYAVFLFFLYKSNPKKIWIHLIVLTCCIALADQFASALCKPLFERLRPCNNPDIRPYLLLIDGVCGGMYGFVSSHAANTFAVFTFLTIKHVFTKKVFIYLLFFWAFIVSLSRVYLGVHYPGDVLCGAIVGVAGTFLLVWVEGVVERKFFYSK